MEKKREYFRKNITSVQNGIRSFKTTSKQCRTRGIYVLYKKTEFTRNLYEKQSTKVLPKTACKNSKLLKN